jgi:hypothetical protein
MNVLNAKIKQTETIHDKKAKKNIPTTVAAEVAVSSPRVMTVIVRVRKLLVDRDRFVKSLHKANRNVAWSK